MQPKHFSSVCAWVPSTLLCLPSQPSAKTRQQNTGCPNSVCNCLQTIPDHQAQKVLKPSQAKPTFNVLPKAHGGRHCAVCLRLAAAFLFHHLIVAQSIIRAHLLLLPLVPRRELFGEGEHGKDDEEHGNGTEEKATPPSTRKEKPTSAPHKNPGAVLQAGLAAKVHLQALRAKGWSGTKGPGCKMLLLVCLWIKACIQNPPNLVKQCQL